MPDTRTRTLANAATVGTGLALAAVVRRTLAQLGEESLQGEVALITGGSRGLGLALARELAGEGCRLAICARDAAALDRARVELEAAGAEVMTQVCDVGDRAQVEALIEAVTARFGRVDLLINNAGIITVGAVEAMTVEDFRKAMDVDFWGVVYPTLAVLPQMKRRRRGRIVNITSMGGKISMPHFLPYNSAKFAAVGFSEGLHAELAPDGIKVTTVVPGEMQTGSHLHAEFAGDKEKEYRWFALGASAPFTMRADRAARIIVRGIKRGTPEVTYPISAKLAARLNGLFPGATAGILSVVDRLLPDAEGRRGNATAGGEVQAEIGSPALDKATTLGQNASEQFNQYPAPGQPAPSPSGD